MKDLLGRLKVACSEAKTGWRRIQGGAQNACPLWNLVIRKRAKAKDTMELIRVIDELYNALVDPMFEMTSRKS